MDQIQFNFVHFVLSLLLFLASEIKENSIGINVYNFSFGFLDCALKKHCQKEYFKYSVSFILPFLFLISFGWLTSAVVIPLFIA